MRGTLLAIFLPGLLLLLSCEDGTVSTSDDIFIYIDAEPEYILAGYGSDLPKPSYGSTTVTARVVNSSFMPLQGIGVLFSADPLGDAGGLRSNGRPVKTNSEGRASDLLINDRSTTITVQSGSATTTLNIPYILENKPPTARISADPNPVEVNRNVVFDGADSGDTDGVITNYKWEFWPDHSCNIGEIPTRPDSVQDPPSETLEGDMLGVVVKQFDHAQTVIVFLTVTDNNMATDDAGYCEEVADILP